MDTRPSRGSFFTNKFWKPGLIDSYGGIHVQVSMVFVQWKSQAACLFPSNLSNCDQTTGDGTIIIEELIDILRPRTAVVRDLLTSAQASWTNRHVGGESP